jgi:hypothetical protein
LTFILAGHVGSQASLSRPTPRAAAMSQSGGGRWVGVVVVVGGWAVAVVGVGRRCWRIAGRRGVRVEAAVAAQFGELLQTEVRHFAETEIFEEVAGFDVGLRAADVEGVGIHVDGAAKASGSVDHAGDETTSTGSVGAKRAK